MKGQQMAKRTEQMRLPTLKLDGYQLASGVPPERMRARLRKGQIVKLIFETLGPNQKDVFGERMWVIIDGREGPYYVGTLNSFPVNDILTKHPTQRLKCGQKVVFLPEHVIDVWNTSAGAAAISAAAP